MYNEELETWWASLSVPQKERVARKALTKASPDGAPAEEADYRYPACSRWWNALPADRQRAIHDHCVSRHGYLLREWDDANPYGD